MSETASHTDFEPSDVRPGLLGKLAAALALVLLIAPYLIVAIYPAAVRQAAPTRAALQAQAPALQLDPSADLARFRRDEDARLASYGWINRPNGTVRVPIERAMDLLVARGLPDWPKP